MSERSSFVTEYLYCTRCFQICKQLLVKDDKYLKGVVIPSWENNRSLPIIAGKLGSLAPEGASLWMETELKPILDEQLCHLVRIAVLEEGGKSEIFVCGPGS